jgi:molybdopterin synthase sulfur carrier subunit
MSVLVRIPTPLQTLTGGSPQVKADGATARELLADLESKYAGIGERLLDGEGRLRRFVNLYLNDEDVRFLENLETPVKPGDTVSIVPAIAGG